MPIQENNSQTFKNSAELRKTPTKLLVQVKSYGAFAQGEVIFDNDSVDTLKTKNYLHVEMNFEYNAVRFDKVNSFNNDYKYEYNDIKISEIEFWRVDYLIEKSKVIFADITMEDGSLIKKETTIKEDDKKIIVDLNDLDVTFNNVSRIDLIWPKLFSKVQGLRHYNRD